MKIKKLLSIIMTMNNSRLDNMTHEEASHSFIESVNRMYETVIELQNNSKNKYRDLKDELMELPLESRKIRFYVEDEYEKPTQAQVKLFPILEGEDPNAYTQINGRIDMILRNTNEMGELIIEAPKYEHVGFSQGQIGIKKVIGYMIRISKGSEYKILEQIYRVTDTEFGDENFRFQLTRLVDIGSLGWVAGDLHHHSIYSSPTYGGTDDVIESAKEVKDSMVSMGLSFGALSDHHNILNHTEWKKTRDTSFLPIVSKEISTSNGHVMSLNVEEDVIYNIPEKKDRNFDYLYHEFIRITDIIKNNHGLAQINHPRDMNPAISLSSQMTTHIEMFDTMEIWNGSIPFMQGTTNDQAYKLWIELLKENRYIPATSGSDTHNTKADDYHQMYNELIWFIHQLEGETRDVENKEIKQLIELFKASSQSFEKWAKESLGTGCVRTYVYSNKLQTKEIIKSLKAGKSFLTNGPLLIPIMMNKTMGDSIQISNIVTIPISIRLMSNRPLETLTIQSKKGVIETIILKSLNSGSDLVSKSILTSVEEDKQGVIDMNIQVKINSEIFENSDWVICRAYSDHVTQVITNPIFINRVLEG